MTAQLARYSPNKATEVNRPACVGFAHHRADLVPAFRIFGGTGAVASVSADPIQWIRWLPYLLDQKTGPFRADRRIISECPVVRPLQKAMMKQTVKRVVSAVLRAPAVWPAVRLSLGTLAAVYARLERLRTADESCRAEQEQFQAKCRDLFAGRTVLYGPFAGLKYPALRSFGSTLYPKLLGSYEHELHPTLEVILRRPYNAVVDIGCAEGYYAVGLARHFPGATVYAYDTDAEALQQCVEMAALNGVRVTPDGFCDRARLAGLSLGDRALVVSDCEGYENELFDAALADQLRRHDFLIETHDFICIESTQNMLDRFSPTHHCVLVESVDDILKAYRYEFPERNNFTLAERRQLLGEQRPTIMRWVFASARDRS